MTLAKSTDKLMQYTVTMPLLMLSPVEQAVFNLVVLLLFGMVFIAAYLYLPDHVATVTRRATFYFFGNDSAPRMIQRAVSSGLQDGMAETLRAKAEL